METEPEIFLAAATRTRIAAEGPQRTLVGRVMGSKKGAELQTRHDRFCCACLALIPIEWAWSTRRVKNSENRDFSRVEDGFTQKIRRFLR
jgi:hypothetical protein